MKQFDPLFRLVALVPAAGVGARAAPARTGQRGQVPKQYCPLRGQPMLRLAVSALLQDARVEQVRVIVAAQDDQAADALAGLPRTVVRPCGGGTRAQTVLNALQDAALHPDDWVLVHDAARPGLPADTLARLIDVCLARGDGGLLALPVADTVKRAGAIVRTPSSGSATANEAYVAATVVRDDLWLAQTPQMFRAGPLQGALARALAEGLPLTDEASAMEAAGYQPILVPGSVRNAKVTWPDDFQWVESWL